MDSPTIQKLNHTHDAIARWLVANPTAPLRDCAQAFGYSQGWISIIIHSQAFKARMKELNGVADEIVVTDITARLTALAAEALEGTLDEVQKARALGGMEHRGFLKATAESTLEALGYGPKGNNAGRVQVNLQNNGGGNMGVLVVDQSALAAARERMLEVTNGVPALPAT